MNKKMDYLSYIEEEKKRQFFLTNLSREYCPDVLFQSDEPYRSFDRTIQLSSIDNMSSSTKVHLTISSSPIFCDISLTSIFYFNLEKIKKNYDVDIISGIYPFLEQHKNFTSNFIDCYNEIILRFGSVKPHLSLVIDEENNTWKTIFIKIPYKSDFEKAFNLLDDLLQNWMFLQPQEFRKFVTISIL